MSFNKIISFARVVNLDSTFIYEATQVICFK